jgi:hypothetical protein
MAGELSFKQLLSAHKIRQYAGMSCDSLDRLKLHLSRGVAVGKHGDGNPPGCLQAYQLVDGEYCA